MDFGWLWDANVGSSLVTNVGDVGNEGDYAYVGAGAL